VGKFHGKNANVFWKGGTVAMSAQSWVVDITADIAEVTEMQDDWKKYLAGENNWTASVEGIHQGSAVSKIGTSGSASIGTDPTGNEAKLDLYLVYADSDYNYLYGDAVCVSITPTVDSKDAGKVAYKFQGIGSLTYDSATSVHSY